MPISLTPHNKVELVGCFYDIDRSLRVEVKGGAAELLQPHKVYTVRTCSTCRRGHMAACAS